MKLLPLMNMCVSASWGLCFFNAYRGVGQTRLGVIVGGALGFILWRMMKRMGFWFIQRFQLNDPMPSMRKLLTGWCFCCVLLLLVFAAPWVACAWIEWIAS